MIDALVIEPGIGGFYKTQVNDWQDYNRIVGGYFECPPLDDNRLSLFVNEEGKLTGLEPNMLATAIYHAFSKAAAAIGDVIHGTVVVTGGVDANGNTMSLDSETSDKLVNVMQSIVAAGLL